MLDLIFILKTHNAFPKLISLFIPNLSLWIWKKATKNWYFTKVGAFSVDFTNVNLLIKGIKQNWENKEMTLNYTIIAAHFSICFLQLI